MLGPTAWMGGEWAEGYNKKLKPGLLIEGMQNHCGRVLEDCFPK